MPERNPLVFLQDILDSISKIRKYTEGMDYEAFSESDLVTDAVVRNFEIIGEASNHIQEDIKSKYPDIPWNKMKGMRNLVIHEYFGVDYSIIWKTIESALPALGEKIEKVVEAEGNPA